MRIYFDNCALGRLFDDQSQPRVVAERHAVLAIFKAVQAGSYHWIASEVLRDEIARNADSVRRFDTLLLLASAGESLRLTQSILARSHALVQLGFAHGDAQHIAFAETAGVDAMLTTDDRLIRRAAKCLQQKQLTASVANPVDWLRKVTHG